MLDVTELCMRALLQLKEQNAQEMAADPSVEGIDYDFFVSKNLAVGCIRDGKITERAPGEGIEAGQVLTLLAATDGVLYGTLYDEGKLWETGEYFNHVVALDPETLGVIRDYGDLN